jgi:outer membrane protein assembly factor BamB
MLVVTVSWQQCRGHIGGTMTRFQKSLAFIVVAASISIAPVAAAPVLKMTPAIGHPKISTTVSGSGFTAGEAVDVYFDTTDKFIVFTDSTGKFPARAFTVPKDALPGTHWVTAVGRKSGDGLQRAFTVRTDWPQFGFEPRDRGRNPYENVIDASNAGTLDITWSHATGAEIASSPIVAGGLVYVGSEDDKLYALTTAGAVKWTATTGSAIESTPAVARGNVYVGSDDHSVYALNAATGAPVWTAATGGAVTSSPVVVGNTLYVGSADGGVHAFNATTGHSIWTTVTSNPIQYSTPAVANGIVYIGSDDGNLYALNATTGAILWSYLTGGVVESSPAVANGLVYFESGDHDLYALNATNGAFVWSFQTGTNGDGAPRIVNGTVFAADGGSVYALDAATGVEQWSTALGGMQRNALSIANGVGYVAVWGKRNIFALDLDSGARLWSAATASFLANAVPAIADGKVYVGSEDNSLYAFALDGGFNATYNANRLPPPYASLHPDYRLKPLNQVRRPRPAIH